MSNEDKVQIACTIPQGVVLTNYKTVPNPDTPGATRLVPDKTVTLLGPGGHVAGAARAVTEVDAAFWRQFVTDNKDHHLLTSGTVFDVKKENT